MQHCQTIAITNRHLCHGDFIAQIMRVCEMGVDAVVLREKDMTEDAYEQLARQIIPICERANVDCILHTFIDVAKRLGVDKIHLPLGLLKTYKPARLSRYSLVGTSVHSAQEAQEAERIGVDYIMAGHVYTTDCKKDLPPRGLGFLREVCESVTIPVYAIGGIKRDDSVQRREVMQCGAQGICIMSGFMKDNVD